MRKLILIFFGLFLVVHGDEFHTNLWKRKKPEENRKPRSFPPTEGNSPLIRETEENFHERPSGESCKLSKQSKINQQETDPEFWQSKAKAELEKALRLQHREKKIAKNVILFLGDGMASASVTTGRVLKGQKEGKLGSEADLSMDGAEYMGFAKTYNVDAQVPDSAGTATAYLTGVKTDIAVLGLTAAVVPNNCSSSKGTEVDSILINSYDAGKSTGIVTTTRLNHATPGGAYAHTPYRYWYGDIDLPEEAIRNGCTDVAFQLYRSSQKINVMLGGGRKYFRPRTTKDDEYKDQNNYRGDGQDLIEKWRENMKYLGRNAEYVWNKKDFDEVNVNNIDHLWGMFEPVDMQFEVDRNKEDEPSLAEMTEKAIKILQKNENGFFLLVEGGRIDHAHHDANAYRAIHEVLAFDDAIAKGKEMTSSDDTLIVVTADHGHTFTFAGYPDRGVPLFGLSGEIGKPDVWTDDAKPWTGLLYGNGLGYQGDGDDYTKPVDRQTLTEEITGDKDYLQQSGVPVQIETHGGDDIAILASGPMSHLFHSTHQQSYIAHIMKYASCVGGVTQLCEEMQQQQEEQNIKTTTVAFLGYQLDRSHTEQALNAMFGIEVALLGSTILACLVRRRKS